MKATIHGIEVEGTPSEIAELVRLVGESEKVQKIVKDVEYIKQRSPYVPWEDSKWGIRQGQTVTIGDTFGSVTYTGPYTMLWNSDGPDGVGAKVK